MTEVSGRESRRKKNAFRAEFAKKARTEFWRYPYSRIEENQKDTRKEEVVCVNHTNAGDLISMVISGIEISTTDPLSFPRERSTWTDEQFSKTEGGVYSKLKRKMEDADTLTKNKIVEWIKDGKLENLFSDYYDRYDEENINDLSSYRNPLCERLQIYHTATLSHLNGCGSSIQTIAKKSAPIDTFVSVVVRTLLLMTTTYPNSRLSIFSKTMTTGFTHHIPKSLIIFIQSVVLCE